MQVLGGRGADVGDEKGEIFGGRELDAALAVLAVVHGGAGAGDSRLTDCWKVGERYAVIVDGDFFSFEGGGGASRIEVERETRQGGRGGWGGGDEQLRDRRTLRDGMKKKSKTMKKGQACY